MFVLSLPNRGYLELMIRIDKKLQHYPGLFLGGNYRCGVSVGDCLEYGCRVADELEHYLTYAPCSFLGEIEEGVAS